ncbi:MAG: DNA topoisomerase [Oscillospiraceae bacterium]|nr:DNA topoisomerase [Oscillospiraceae bacterium]
MIDSVTEVVSALQELEQDNEEQSERINNLFETGLNLDKRVVNNAGITDHHALIPTNLVKNVNLINALTDDEKKIFNLIVNRLLCALDQPEDSSFTVENATVKDCEKKPPRRYNDSTLLSVMENIDNLIDDKVLKTNIKGKGIGTPATRAAIISDRKPMEIKHKSKYDGEPIADCPRCKKKNIDRKVYETKDNFTCEGGKSCGFTIWKKDKFNYYFNTITKKKAIDLIAGKQVMMKRKNKEGKEYEALHFLSDDGVYINFKLVLKEKSEPLGLCPRCKEQGAEKQILEGKMNFYCESGKDGCGWTIWKKNNKPEVTVTAKHIKELLTQGYTNFSIKIHENSPVTKKYCIVNNGKYVNFREYNG